MHLTFPYSPCLHSISQSIWLLPFFINTLLTFLLTFVKIFRQSQMDKE
uniref:Uncharacterized protein n=1 Tax=Cyanidioschyzon merolae (strain NIES-3377 / 10D) TaxID=280699 RepID=Q85G41_CYAM1|nr:ORF47 [Cyanidioschyzon merolae strain 10D]BAC76150.1 unnamed protein product [Cyanidioschyzon merolae strain 10D]